MDGSANGDSTYSKKVGDLERDIKDQHSKQHMTTDFGSKIDDPDHWLKVANEDKIGPHLLEDQQARERASLCLT